MNLYHSASVGAANVRSFVAAGVAVCCLSVCALQATAMEPLARAVLPKTYRVYVGTYTSGDSQGIYLFEMDTASGTLKPMGLAAETVNPSFLAFHPGKPWVYAVGEIGDFEGRRTGAVSAFSVDAKTGKLSLLNQQPSGGRGPCHVSLHPAGRHVLVANYSSGSAAVLPIEPDGSLAEASSVVQHEGSGPHPQRQQGPHAHYISTDASGRFAFVADLGLDRVMVYRFDRAKGSIEPNDPPSASVPPGGGPRHFAFHPSERFAYTNNELASSVTAFTYDADRGALSGIQTITTLPEDFQDSNSTAQILVHPSGKFLYCSNRGHDSIAMYAIDQGTGKLTAIGHQSTGGETPRNFNIDPTGTWLIAANQKTGTLCVFRIDSESGRLQQVGSPAPVPTPVCVKFVSPEK
jgi:6-phosphogluconolactonase